VETILIGSHRGPRHNGRWTQFDWLEFGTSLGPAGPKEKHSFACLNTQGGAGILGLFLITRRYS